MTKLLSDTANLELKAASMTDLKALCLGLLDNMNDKTVALSHQKRTNRLLAAKIGTLEMKLRNLSGNLSKSALLTPSQLLLNNYASAKVDEDLRISRIKREVPARNGESSESSKSLISSEYETQSLSDMSSELKQLNYIKIINDDDEDDLNDENFMKTLNSNDEETEELCALPPEIQKLVDEAMKNLDDA